MKSLMFAHFNPQLVSQFVPENHPQFDRTPGSPPQVRDFLHRMGQVSDYAATLCDMERSAIPFFQAARSSGFSEVTTEQILAWIKRTHQIIAPTLLEPVAIVPGQYAEVTVLRWHHSIAMERDLFSLYSSGFSFAASVRTVFEKYNVSHLAANFLSIFQKAKDDQTIVVNESKRPWRKAYFAQLKTKLKPEEFKLQRDYQALFNRVIDAYHQGKLTPNEIAVINQIFTIGNNPENIPRLMEEFASNLLHKLKNCKGDLNDIAALAHYIYYGITNIHPFANANGRTATVDMNTMLIVFEYPSILFRTRAEMADPNSPYSRVIQNINDPEVLRDYIKARIIAAQKVILSDNDILDIQTTEQCLELWEILCRLLEIQTPYAVVQAKYYVNLSIVAPTIMQPNNPLLHQAKALIEAYKKNPTPVATPQPPKETLAGSSTQPS